MHLKFETYKICKNHHFPFFISQTPTEIPICRIFVAKLSIFTYISLKIGYFELSDYYDVTVTSYVIYWYLF